MNILHNTKENLMKKLMILVALFAFTFCSLMALGLSSCGDSFFDVQMDQNIETKDAYKKSLNYYKTYSDWGLFDNIVEE